MRKTDDSTSNRVKIGDECVQSHPGIRAIRPASGGVMSQGNNRFPRKFDFFNQNLDDCCKNNQYPG
jgi:hypothetical protein